MHTSAPSPPVSSWIALDRDRSSCAVDRVRRAESTGRSRACESSMSTATIVRRPGEAGPRDGGVADSPTSEHRDRCRRADTPPVLSAAPSPAMTPHPSSPAASGRRRPDRPWCTGPRRRASCRRTLRCPVRATSGRPSSASSSAGALCVAKQYQGRPRLARPAVATHRAPVEDDEVAGLEVGHASVPTASTIPAAS